jgi:hypothetical protein
MTMKLKIAALCALLLPLTAYAAEIPPAQLSPDQQAAEKVAADEHKLPPGWPRDGAVKLIENDRGIAWNVTYYMNKSSPLHEHPYYFAGMDLNTGSVVTRKPGETNWTQPGVVKKDAMWFLPKGLTHAEMTVTDPGRHTMVVDVKDKRVPEAANTTSYPSNKYAPSQTKVVDNDMVTIWDAAWGPRDGAMSFDTRDMFLCFAEGGDLVVQEDGKPAEIHHVKTGEAMFLTGGTARAISSGPGTTVRAMLVEMK